MRDRLIELLKPYVSGCACEDESGSCELTTCRDCNAQVLADHILADGWIRLTLSIGQKVWELCEWTYKDTEIRECTVSMLQQKADKSWKIRITVNHSVYDITPDKLGKTIFLTREAAENALKERERG